MAISGVYTKAMSQYKQAEVLGRIHIQGQSAGRNPLQTGIGSLAGLDSLGGGSSHTFKNELHSIHQAVVKPLEKQGQVAEHAIRDHVFGSGNIEHTATATQELSTQIEVTSQFLRLLNEGLKDLTRGTMGG